MGVFVLELWVGVGSGVSVEKGGKLTYKRCVNVVLPVMATARAFALICPICVPLRLKRWGKG